MQFGEQVSTENRWR